jgi:type IV secretory pathway VirB2 component (pilin)
MKQEVPSQNPADRSKLRQQPRIIYRSWQESLGQVAIVACILALPFLMSPANAAAADGITQAAQSMYTYVRALGAAVTTLGLAGVAFKLMVQHDREGLAPMMYVIGGGMIMLLAPTLVGLMQGWTGSAQAISGWS